MVFAKAKRSHHRKYAEETPKVDYTRAFATSRRTDIGLVDDVSWARRQGGWTGGQATFRGFRAATGVAATGTEKLIAASCPKIKLWLRDDGGVCAGMYERLGLW